MEHTIGKTVYVDDDFIKYAQDMLCIVVKKFTPGYCEEIANTFRDLKGTEADDKILRDKILDWHSAFDLNTLNDIYKAVEKMLEYKSDYADVPKEIHLTHDVMINDYHKVVKVFDGLGFHIEHPLDIFLVLGVPYKEGLFCNDRVKILLYNSFTSCKQLCAIGYFNSSTCNYDVVFIGPIDDAIYYLRDESDPISTYKEFGKFYSVQPDDVEISSEGIFLYDSPGISEISYNVRMKYLLRALVPDLVPLASHLYPETTYPIKDSEEIYYRDSNGYISRCFIFPKHIPNTTMEHVNVLAELSRSKGQYLNKITIEHMDYCAEDLMRNCGCNLADYKDILDAFHEAEVTGFYVDQNMHDRIPNGMLYYVKDDNSGLVFTFVGANVKSGYLVDISKIDSHPYLNILNTCNACI